LWAHDKDARVKQPLLGIVASALVIALSLGYVTLFDLPTFLGWVSFVMLCLIPAQIVLVVLSPNPPFVARLAQPARGLALLAVTIVAATIAAPVVLQVVGEGISPPGPIPSQFAVIVVPTTFFLAIMFGGWPFTALSKSSGLAALLVLVAAYVITFAVFRAFFNYDFMQGAPVYLASAPAGAHNAVAALVFYVTALAGMFLMLHFDLWPFTKAPALMKQPVLGLVWLAVSLALAAAVMQVTMVSMSKTPLWILTRVTAPFIFGTIIVLNMLQNSLFAKLRQPGKGMANAVAAAAIGVALGQMYGYYSDWLFNELPMGLPNFEYELWLVNALLSVTFPFLIFYAAYFNYWPLALSPAAEPAEAART
jgi:hypothetical protein